MGKVREFFENSGFEPADIPKAFIIHELLGMGFAAAAWGACYALQPSKRVGAPISAALRKSPAGRRTLLVYHRNARRASVKLQTMLRGRTNAERLTVSFTESLGFRALVKPVTLPLKFYITWKILVDKSKQKEKPFVWGTGSSAGNK